MFFFALLRGNYCSGVDLDGLNAEMPTSGTLKSGECFFYSTTPPPPTYLVIYSSPDSHINQPSHDMYLSTVASMTLKMKKSFSVMKMHEYAANFKIK